MNNLNLVRVENGDVFTDSKIIAEGTNNQHHSVTRVLRNYPEDFKEFGEIRFTELNSKNPLGGRPQKIYLLNETQATLLMSYLDNNEIVREFKKKLVKEFIRMKEYIKQQQTPSYMIDDEIERAKRWIQEKEQHKLEMKQKDDIIEEQAPKVEYYDKIMKSDSTFTISTMASDYGMSGRAFNSLLHELGIQYKESGRWYLYQKHRGNGYTKTESYPLKNGYFNRHMKWTEKGFKFIYDVLKEEGILPECEREVA